MTEANNALDLFAELENLDVTDLQDLNNIQTGGGRGLLPKGTAFVRPISYVEYGTQKQREFEGKTKDPTPTFEICFAIVGGSGVNLKGEPEKYVLEEGNFPTIKSYEKPLSLFEKSACIKIHKALNRVGNKCSHMVQKLSESPLYQISITHEIPTKGANAGKTVAKFDLTTLQPAFDSIRGEEVQMPVLDKSKIQAFLWDKPSLGQWDSIHIAGQWDAQVDEATGAIKKPARSKNFLQEKIMMAINFEGSKIQKLLQADNRDVALAVPSLEAPVDAVVQAPPVDTPVPEGSVLAAPELD